MPWNYLLRFTSLPCAISSLRAKMNIKNVKQKRISCASSPSSSSFLFPTNLLCLYVSIDTDVWGRHIVKWIYMLPTNEKLHCSILYFFFVLLLTGQVDLWTRKSVGCACSWKDNEHDHAKDSNGNKHEMLDKNLTLHNGHHKHGHQLNLNCACCVKGGCQCGEQAPNRCSQCGLENHCLNSTYLLYKFVSNYSYHFARIALH